MSKFEAVKWKNKSVDRQHICITSTPIVRKIVEPLLKNTNISYFCYGRNYKNGGTFTLHTDNAYYDAWFENQFPMSLSYLNDGMHLWDDTQPKYQIEIRENQFNYGNGLFIVRHFEDYSEIFGYAPPKSESISNIYLNHQDSLNKFNLYFKDKAHKLIEEAKNSLVFTAPNMLLKEKIELDNIEPQALRRHLTTNNFSIKPGSYVALTSRQIQCFHGFLQGKTAIQTGAQLCISPKSVETHLHNIKKQFKCKTRSDLIGVAWDLGIIKSNGWFD
tara:strand:- start:18957 stop:19778 length:822 start_codon:yes stop_codon:yes gene_type:complete